MDETKKLPIGDATDASLIARCQAGDRAAFEELFVSYRDRVYSMAVHFIRNETAAKDITQDVFIKLYYEVPKFRGEAQFQTWLFRLVVNACMDEHRKRRRFVPFHMASEGEVMNFEPAPEPYLREEVSNLVHAAVARLKPKLRLPVLLRYMEDLSYAEIADMLRCSQGTVASRLNRAHRALARRLGHLAAPTGTGAGR